MYTSDPAASAASIHCPSGYCPVTVLLKNLFTRFRSGKRDATLQIFDQAAAVAEALERLNATDAGLSLAHLQVMEQSLRDVTFRYVVVYRDERPVFFTYFQLFALSARNFNLHRDTSFVRRIMGMLLDMKKARLLVSGDALRTGATAYVYDPFVVQEKDVAATMMQLADKVAAEVSAAAVLLPGISCKDCVTGTEQTNTFGYTTPMADSIMEMPVDPSWTSIQDYVGALTRKYRARANKVLQATAHLSIRQMDAAEVLKRRNEIRKLFQQVLDRQAFVLTSSGADYLVQLKQLYPDQFEVTGYFDGKRLVAFSSAFVEEKEYEMFYVGFDSELNEQVPLYFQLLLTGLERAVALGKKRLGLGRTSFDAKASLGAQAVPQDYAVKLRRMPDAAMSWLSCYFNAIEDGKWRLRNPLKSATTSKETA